MEDVNEIKLPDISILFGATPSKITFQVKSCKEDFTYSMTENGSAVAVTWVNMLTRIHCIANVFLYHEMNVNMSLGFPTTRTHSRIQTKYVAPVVEKYWDNLKSSVVEEHRSAKVVVSGELNIKSLNKLMK